MGGNFQKCSLIMLIVFKLFFIVNVFYYSMQNSGDIFESNHSEVEVKNQTKNKIGPLNYLNYSQIEVIEIEKKVNNCFLYTRLLVF